MRVFCIYPRGVLTKRVFLLPADRGSKMEERYLRLKQLVGSKKEGIPPMIPVAKSTIWEWVKAGKFPAPVKLGQATTCWRLSDIQRFLESGV